MTRKDYVATAEILNAYADVIDLMEFKNLVDDFSAMFEEDNPRFNSDKFFEACVKN